MLPLYILCFLKSDMRVKLLGVRFSTKYTRKSFMLDKFQPLSSLVGGGGLFLFQIKSNNAIMNQDTKAGYNFDFMFIIMPLLMA